MGLLHPSKSANFFYAFIAFTFHNVVSKGQFLSKGLVGILNSSEKRTKLFKLEGESQNLRQIEHSSKSI